MVNGYKGGFYPPTNKVFYAKLNPKKNCYEIFEKRYTESTYQRYDVLHRSNISTRKDAENQLVSLNFNKGVVR